MRLHFWPTLQSRLPTASNWSPSNLLRTPFPSSWCVDSRHFCILLSFCSILSVLLPFTFFRWSIALPHMDWFSFDLWKASATPWTPVSVPPCPCVQPPFDLISISGAADTCLFRAFERCLMPVLGCNMTSRIPRLPGRLWICYHRICERHVAIIMELWRWCTRLYVCLDIRRELKSDCLGSLVSAFPYVTKHAVGVFVPKRGRIPKCK